MEPVLVELDGLSRMQAVVVGGLGFVGAHLVRDLIGAGVATHVLDRQELVPGPPQPLTSAGKLAWRIEHLLAGAEIARCDVADKRQVEAALSGRDIDCLFYLAALPIVHLANQSFAEAGDSMVRGLMNCLEVARECGRVRRVVYVSSSMVYGSFDQQLLPETAATSPTNLYGGFKLAGETLTRAYLANAGIEHVIVRPTGVYGPTALNGTVVQTFCETALQGGVLEGRDAKTTFVDFTWVQDLAEGLMRAGLTPGVDGEVFNLSRGQARSLKALADLVVTAVPGTEVRFVAEPDLTRPRRGGGLDIGKARARLGYDPRVDLEAGVTRYLEFLQSGGALRRADFTHA